MNFGIGHSPDAVSFAQPAVQDATTSTRTCLSFIMHYTYNYLLKYLLLIAKLLPTPPPPSPTCFYTQIHNTKCSFHLFVSSITHCTQYSIRPIYIVVFQCDADPTEHAHPSIRSTRDLDSGSGVLVRDDLSYLLSPIDHLVLLTFVQNVPIPFSHIE